MPRLSFGSVSEAVEPLGLGQREGLAHSGALDQGCQFKVESVRGVGRGVLDNTVPDMPDHAQFQGDNCARK